MFYGVKDKGSLAVTSMTVLLLVATVAVSVMIMTSVTDNALARNERYANGDDVSQAASVDNDCLRMGIRIIYTHAKNAFPDFC